MGRALTAAVPRPRRVMTPMRATLILLGAVLSPCSLGEASPSPQRVPAGDFTRWLTQHPLKPGTSLLLEPGDHTLSETLHLGPNATGLRLSGGTTVARGARITGGFAVPASAWSTSCAGKRPLGSEGGVCWSAHLPAGTWAPGADPPRQLWTGHGRTRRTRARHPNLWNRDASAVQASPYMIWSSPLTVDYGGAHCSAHGCLPPCQNHSVCDAAHEENKYGFRYNATTDGELMALLASENCSEAPAPGHGYCAGLEAVVYHGWTVSRSFVAGIFTPGHSVHLRNGADRPIGFWVRTVCRVSQNQLEMKQQLLSQTQKGTDCGATDSAVVAERARLRGRAALLPRKF
jgi:hypothetical protein